MLLNALKIILLVTSLDSAYAQLGITDRSIDLYAQYQSELIQSGMDPAKIMEINNALLLNIDNYRVDNSNRKRASFLTQAQMKEVLNSINSHPVVSMMKLQKYDPKDTIGFCFGRAAYVHLELLRRGVAKDAIRKTFVLGTMTAGTLSWKYHVATAVMGDDNRWYVIDSYHWQPMRIEDWYKHYLEMSPDRTLRLYVTDARKLHPADPGYNNKRGLYDPYLNGYFVDLFKSIKDNPKVQKFPPTYKGFCATAVDCARRWFQALLGEKAN